ncbi:kinase interacting family protein [Arabidopsis lyrata subsp. lyrata]|uniref:Kinase interacting family protein n=1 Tax=Arabidopsis lyrata subsp. lyrata TaxID=81972 RepID=D7KJT4_ARALL|nr:protein NETWORKED 2B [Arabidopsis lyrata subsp. lyrata]EFH68778.1 kinase interacting family protein [Arabidopsis lyrata subsp. lyrata]|eukprot:XP_002892519.1 protein NETWORKED 2B [Arabidopsis lyrata subsp. lyrata]
MLQRAASNAYSWWWASHIRTKQSKWLEHNLQDMEEKVKYTLKIIDEDGDTFAKRAEMYYRKRPEIVNFVEEAFRSYRALAERYDHLSTELQSANHMIATAFPEHVPFPLVDDDDDDGDDPKKPPKHLHLIPTGTNIPQVPEVPKKEFKSQSLMVLSKKGPDVLKSSVSSSALVSSGLSKEEALEEIDKIHKGILVLQTEKEFVRSSYEQSYERYWNLENEVEEMQKRVCSLQDEFGVGAEIEDAEARTLVASTALSSCKETIAKLEETQRLFSEDAEIEKGRIDTATERFEALKTKFEIKVEEQAKKAFDGQESSYESVKESREVDLNENLSNMDFTQKIDELVERVVSLETTALSHTALVKTLRTDTDELHEHIRGLEEDKACLVSDSIDMKKRITALEDELSKVRNLFQRVEDQNKNLQKHLTEANSTAKDLSGKLQEVKMDEDVEGDGINPEAVQEEDPSEDLDSISNGGEIKSAEEIKEAIVVKHSRDQESVQEEKSETRDSCGGLSETESTCFGTEAEDEERRNWRQLLPADGMEDREKVLLDEYTSVLRDYREVKRKLSEVEKKNRDGFFELALQLRELKNAVSCEDVEFHLLRQKPEMPGKDSPHPVERSRSESLSIYPSSNSSFSMEPHQQREDLKRASEQAKEDGVKVKFADINDSLRKKIPTVEEKVRGDIDAVLEENIEFWLRFSTSVHQIQKYHTSVQDLKSELSKIESKQQGNAGSSSNTSLASEAKPIYRHLREIRTELQLWLENSAVLRDELEGRYATLCNIKDEVSRVTSQSGGTKVSSTEISGYQAAKFHGEILNMKQENKKVFNELQAGLDRAKTLRNEVERVVCKLEENLGILNVTATRSLSKNTSSSSGKPRIPLRSFLFGVKLKKYKQQPKQASTIFSCVSPSPALQKQCSYIVPPVKVPEYVKRS